MPVIFSNLALSVRVEERVDSQGQRCNSSLHNSTRQKVPCMLHFVRTVPWGCRLWQSRSRMRLINCNGRYCNYIFGNPRVSQQITVWWQLFHHLPFSQISEQISEQVIVKSGINWEDQGGILNLLRMVLGQYMQPIWDDTMGFRKEKKCNW